MDHSKKDTKTELLNVPRPRPRITTEDFASPPDWRVKKMDGKFESKAGVNIMHIVGQELTHYFGVSGTFLAHFVAYRDFFSTFCHVLGLFLAHFVTFRDLFSTFWCILGYF